MNRINYDGEMQKIISALKKTGEKPKLLLHACCAPCACACVERIKDYFDITLYYYNPNIDGVEEYAKRKAEVERLADLFNVKCLAEEYGAAEFYAAAKGYEDAREGGVRCEKCFTLRLEKTAKTAKNLGFDFISTTLTLSPLKNAAIINEIGKRAAEDFGIKWLYSDFKKRGGYLRSIELSKEYGLYRQNYCGCEFSKNKTPIAGDCELR